MGIAELLLLAVGLAMDAFAVSICKGLSVPRVKPAHAMIAGAYFGGFQALMPTVGFFIGLTFQSYIRRFDHWIAFALLALIGVNMIRESFDRKEEPVDASFGFRSMIVLAVATSIDALAVGVSFAMLFEAASEIVLPVLLIGSITFILSAVGVYVGNFFGTRFKSKAELAGGVILVLIGVRILIEHLMQGK